MEDSDSDVALAVAASIEHQAAEAAVNSSQVGEESWQETLPTSRFERMSYELHGLQVSSDTQRRLIQCRESTSDASKWVVGLRHFASDCANGSEVSFGVLTSVAIASLSQFTA